MRVFVDDREENGYPKSPDLKCRCVIKPVNPLKGALNALLKAFAFYTQKHLSVECFRRLLYSGLGGCLASNNTQQSTRNKSTLKDC